MYLPSLVGDHVIEEIVKLASKTPDGCFVECGVYKGGVASRLYQIAVNQGRELHLFDTFTGIPYKDQIDGHQVGDFSDTSLPELKSAMPKAHFYEGLFPDTMPHDWNKKVAFLHVDVDQYRSTLAVIESFKPFMVPGSIMWFDDYECLISAKTAVNTYFPEPVLTRDICGKFYYKF